MVWPVMACQFLAHVHARNEQFRAANASERSRRLNGRVGKEYDSDLGRLPQTDPSVTGETSKTCNDLGPPIEGKFGPGG